MRNDPSLDFVALGSASTAVPSYVRSAARHFARQGLTPDMLHPFILELFRESRQLKRARSGESPEAARRRAEAQAQRITHLGLRMQIHVLYRIGRGNGVKVAMVLLTAMLGCDRDAARWLLSLCDDSMSSE